MADSRRAVIWAPSARAHLSQALSYIAGDAPRAARKFLAEVMERTGSLETLSERGRIVREFEDTKYRQLVVRRYRMIYRVMPDEVHIVAFIHGARDFARWRHEVDRGLTN